LWCVCACVGCVRGVWGVLGVWGVWGGVGCGCGARAQKKTCQTNRMTTRLKILASHSGRTRDGSTRGAPRGLRHARACPARGGPLPSLWKCWRGRSRAITASAAHSIALDAHDRSPAADRGSACRGSSSPQTPRSQAGCQRPPPPQHAGSVDGQAVARPRHLGQPPDDVLRQPCSNDARGKHTSPKTAAAPNLTVPTKLCIWVEGFFIGVACARRGIHLLGGDIPQMLEQVELGNPSPSNLACCLCLCRQCVVAA